MSDFKPTCPRCRTKLGEGARYCVACGAHTGLVPLRRDRSASAPTAPRPPEETTGRYVVRETEGYRITLPVRDGKGASQARPGIECVVLDTATNHRRVASFTSEQFMGRRTRKQMFECARQSARQRCDELNRATA